jgi:hypothetical protein
MWRKNACLLFFLLLGGILYAQQDCKLEQQISVRFQETPIAEVLSTLREKHQLPLTYSLNRIPQDIVVNLSQQNGSVASCLQGIVQGNDLTFECIAGKIVVYQRFKPKVESPPKQPTQTIRGRVLDMDSQLPIAFAAVVLLNSKPLRGSYTNEQGYFRIEGVPVGRWFLEVRHVEFETYQKMDLLISSGKEVVLELKLSQKVSTLETVLITNETALTDPLNPFLSTSYQRYEVEEAKRYPASYGDPARHAQAFAGLVGQNDIRNELVIRGNNPRGILWRLDGVEIPNPNHFAREGTASGSVSAISTNLMADSEFLTGAYPAQYGNAMSGIFDLRIREGNDSLFEHSLQIGTLGLELATEGPFARKRGYKGSYLINYRASVLNMIGVLLDTILVDEELTNYNDLAVKLHFPTKRGAWDFLALGGNSRSGLPTDDRRRNRLNNGLAITNLAYRRTIGDDSYFKGSLSYMGNQVDNLIFDVDSLALYEQTERTGSLILRFNWLVHKRFSPRWIAEAGGTESLEGFSYRGWMGSTLFPAPFNDWLTLDSMGIFRSSQLYFTTRFRKSRDTEWVFGLHAIRHHRIPETSIEPRLGLRLGLADRHRLRLGAGIHSRREPLLYYLHLNTEGELFNPKLKLPKAFHVVLGYDFLASPDWALTAEGYFQLLYNLPVSLDSTQGAFSTLLQPEGYFSGELANRGLGMNQGLELSLHKRFSKQWYFLGTGSFYFSRYVGGDGKFRPSPYDGPFQFSLLGGKEFAVGRNGRPHLLSLNGKLFFNNQQRLVVLDPDVYLQTNRYVQNFRQVDCPSCEYQPYWRFDFQLIYRRNHKRFAGEWRVDIQNITRRVNLKEIVYDPTRDVAFPQYHFRLLPVLSYKFEI